MGHGDDSVAESLSETFPPFIAQGATCHFDRFARRFLPCRDIKIDLDKFSPEPPGMTLGHLLVAVAFIAAQVEIAMGSHTSVAERDEQVEQRDRVGPATETDDDSRVSINQPFCLTGSLFSEW